MSLLENLSKAQREAVEHTDGPVLVFAGAGSGKTRVLTYRVAHLIAKGVQPGNILAVTFTNKAANEMKERIAALVGERAKEIWAGTFHSTCARILRQNGQHIGIPRDFTIYDDDDQMALIKESIDQCALDPKKFEPRAMLTLISRAKEQLIDHWDFPKKFRGEIERGAARVYEAYQEKLRLNRALDFDDLIMQTVCLLRERPGILEMYQNKFRYILVDEYQDINYAQYTFVTLLSRKHRNLCVVGDDDQSIYKWRGADVGIILQFEYDFKDAKVFKLEQNYRSTKRILEAAHEIVSKNRSRQDKQLWTDNDEGSEIYVYETANEQEEASLIANKIQDKVATEGRKLSDFVILYRMNAQSRVFEDVFVNHRIPYKLIGSVRFYQRKEIKDILAYMRLAHNPTESVSLKRVINVPARGIGPTSLSRIEEYAAIQGITLWTALSQVDEIPDIPGKARREVKAFVKLIEFLHGVRNKYGVHRLMEEVLENTAYIRAIMDLGRGSMEAESRVENVKELLSVAEEFMRSSETPTLETFLEQVALVSDIDTYDESGQAVTLMTLHSAKGLEFPVVFIVGLEEGIFPHRRSIRDADELEEERRLCYVGMTRAKEELHLSHAVQRMMMGNTVSQDRSRFLREIPAHLLYQSVSRPASSTLWRSKVQPSRSSGPSTYKPGDKVSHSQFGEGLVLSSSGTGDDEQVTVAFEDAGVKKLILSYANLQKV